MNRLGMRYNVKSHGHRRGGNSPSTASLTYKAWLNMVKRCKRQKGYVGIVTVCARWGAFENFLADMGERPSREHSIDRFPNQTGNYEPGNCRWATAAEQSRNKSDTRFVRHPATGEEKCLSDWATELGIRKSTLHWRLERWPLERALSVR